MERRHRVRIRHDGAQHEGPAALASVALVLELEPADAGTVDAFEVRIGRSIAQTRMIAHRLFDRDGQTPLGFAANAQLRTMAQLWHAFQTAHGGEIPVSFLTLDDESRTAEPLMEGFIPGADLEASLQQIEQECNLGVRTNSLNPPIYLEAFWGPRKYGQLDAEIERLGDFDIVPNALLDKARRVDVPHNWALVYPENLPDRDQVLAAVKPLVEHRGGRTFALSHGHDPRALFDFMGKLSRLPIQERPYYLLVLGDLDVLSMEFQYFLQSFGAAGRLVFPNPNSYRDYAEKVIRFESQLDNSEPPGPTYIAAYYDDVNARNYADIVQPLASTSDLPAARAVLARGRAHKGRVLDLLRSVPARSPVLIFAHGFEHLTTKGRPAEAVFEDMRRFQGSLILDDFQEPRTLGSASGLLCATDVADGPVSPGGIVILPACYSAGTIDRDTMPEWIHLRMPESVLPEAPFVSALAQALLANLQGPLAVYGHVNRSHQSNYYNPDVEKKSYPYRHYHEMLTALAQGLPIGFGRESCRRMTIHYMAQAMTLSYQIEWLLTGRSRGGSGIGWPRKGIGSYESSFLQYSFGTCNFRNYMILGDPMARIRRI